MNLVFVIAVCTISIQCNNILESHRDVSFIVDVTKS